MDNVIDAYIAQAPREIQGLLSRVRQSVLEVDPELTQTLSYQMPTFKKHGKAVFHFAAQKNHLGIYPTPAAIAHFESRLEGYKTSKGAVQIPYSMLLDEELIKDMVRFNLLGLESG